MNQERKDLLYFAVAVLLITTAIVSLFPLFHITSNWAGNALMFVPGSIALILMIRRRESLREIGWGAGPAVYWVAALVLPTIMIVIAVTVSLKLGYAAAAPASTPAGSLIANPLKLLKNVLIYTAISIPLALGEEFAWRGYAQPRLVRQFGLGKGLLLLGLIWGFWHSPIYYVEGSYPHYPILGPFVMTPIDNLLVVVPMAWLYIRSGSIWVPTFAHAFADVLWGLSGLMFPAQQEIAHWLVLEVVQVVISAVLLADLTVRWKQRVADVPL